MTTTFSTLNVNETQLSFVYSLFNLIGPGLFSVTVSNSTHSELLFSDATDNVIQSPQSISMSPDWDNQTVLNLTFQCNVGSAAKPTRQCYVDTVKINGTFTANTTATVNSFDAEFCGSPTRGTDGRCVNSIYFSAENNTWFAKPGINGSGGGGTGLSGSGTANTIIKFLAPTVIGDSNIIDNGTLITLGSDVSITGEITDATLIEAGNIVIEGNTIKNDQYNLIIEVGGMSGIDIGLNAVNFLDRDFNNVGYADINGYADIEDYLEVGDYADIEGDFDVGNVANGTFLLPTQSSIPGGYFNLAWNTLARLVYQSTLPITFMIETDGPVDEKVFDTFMSGGVFGTQVLYDNLSLSSSPYSIDLTNGQMTFTQNATFEQAVIADEYFETSVVLDKKGKKALDYFTTTSEERSYTNEKGEAVYNHTNEDDSLIYTTMNKTICEPFNITRSFEDPKYSPICETVSILAKSNSRLSELQRDATKELKDKTSTYDSMFEDICREENSKYNKYDWCDLAVAKL